MWYILSIMLGVVLGYGICAALSVAACADCRQALRYLHDLEESEHERTRTRPHTHD